MSLAFISTRYERWIRSADPTHARITDYGIEGFPDDQSVWLEFLPLSRVARLPDNIEYGEPTLNGPRCRKSFDGEGGSLDGIHPASPSELINAIREFCLERQRYGRTRASDPCQLVGRELIARCDRIAPDGEATWTLVPVRHQYPRPGCQCTTCRDYGKRRGRR